MQTDRENTGESGRSPACLGMERRTHRETRSGKGKVRGAVVRDEAVEGVRSQVTRGLEPTLRNGGQ